MTTRARTLIVGLRAFVLLFGAAALWLSREGLNADGIAYLDASDVYLRGGWPASGTGYWSPLYPTLLAAARRILGASPARELLITQAVNFVIFLATFAALECLIHEVRAATAIRRPGAPSPNDSVWLVLVYALFAVATVGWIRVWMVTPDLLVAAITLAVAAVSLRLATGRGAWPSAVTLGVLLALGYLAKAAMFPVAIVVLATLAVARWRFGATRQALMAAIVFFSIAAPQIVYVSRLKHGVTFGDVGRLNYLWFIANVPGPVSSAFPLPARLPSPDSVGQLLRPLDPMRDPRPAIYDIDAPLPGTLPIWYDAGHWYRGVTAPSQPLGIARAVVRHMRVYLELFGFLLVGAAAAALARPMTRRDVLALRPAPVLVVPALAAIAMYALVLVQSRYVAPFALLLFAGLVPPWLTDDLSRRLRLGFAAGAVAGIPLVAHQIRVDAAYWRGTSRSRANVVAALEARGIGPGSRIGFIGEAYDALWARQARLRFVSLVPSTEAERFWEMDASRRRAVLVHMQQHGAQAIVAESPALGVDIEGWERLPSAGVPRSELIVSGGSR